MQVERAIIRLAEAQNGVADRRQLSTLGLDRGAIGPRLRTGRLHVLVRGVYLVGHCVALPLAMETGALLACGEGADLSHHTAWALRSALPPTI